MNFLLTNNINSPIYQVFNTTYFVVLFLTILLSIIVILNRNVLFNLSLKNKNTIITIMGIILLINFIYRRGSLIINGSYNYKINMDLAFCNMTNILFIVYCFTKKEKLYNLCFYMAFGGPLIAIIFPSVSISINSYYFLSFILIHNFLFVFNLMCFFFKKRNYNFNNFFNNYLIIFGILLVVFIFNYIFGTNYNELYWLISDKLINIGFLIKILTNKFTSTIFILLLNFIFIYFGYLFASFIKVDDIY